MAKIAVVIPDKKSNPEGTHDKYFYPDMTGIVNNVIAYNHNLDDFLTEQMWTIEGDTSALDRFLAEPSVKEIAEDEADLLGKDWTPKRVVIVDAQAVIDALLGERSAGRPLPDSLDPEKPAPGLSYTPPFNIKDYTG